MIGDDDGALRYLDQVLSLPSILSAPWLEADPRFDGLRDNPAFAALLQKHAID